LRMEVSGVVEPSAEAWAAINIRIRATGVDLELRAPGDAGQAVFGEVTVGAVDAIPEKLTMYGGREYDWRAWLEIDGTAEEGMVRIMATTEGGDMVDGAFPETLPLAEVVNRLMEMLGDGPQWILTGG